MSIFFKDTYATLWDVKPAEKYTDLNISTSEKDKDGNYVNSSCLLYTSPSPRD